MYRTLYISIYSKHLCSWHYTTHLTNMIMNLLFPMQITIFFVTHSEIMVDSSDAYWSYVDDQLLFEILETDDITIDQSCL